MGDEKDRAALNVKVDKEIHIEAKVKAAREGKTLWEIVEDALRAFLGMQKNGNETEQDDNGA